MGLKSSYTLLLVFVYIIPFVMVSAADHLLFTASKDAKVKVNCLFLVDNSVWVINNIMTMAIANNLVDLLQMKDAFSQVLLLLTSRSGIETKVRSKKQFSEFSVGEEMAMTMIHYTVTVVFAVSSPMVLPVGLVFLVIKHCVDSKLLISGALKARVIESKRFFKICCDIMVFSAVLSHCNTVGVLALKMEGHSIFRLIFCLFNMLFALFQCQSNHHWPIKLIERSSFPGGFAKTALILSKLWTHLGCWLLVVTTPRHMKV